MKRLKALLMILVCMTGFLYTGEIKASTKAFVYSYTDMQSCKNGFLYVKQADSGTAAIYQFDTTTGKSRKVVSEKNGITSFVQSGTTIYYTTADATDFITNSISLTGENKKKVVTGSVIYADSSYVVYEMFAGNKTMIYKKNLSKGTETKLAETKDSLGYVKNLGDTLYFYKYEKSVRRVKLLSMKTSSTKMKLVSSDICSKEDAYYVNLVPDVVSHSGNLFYQYGSYQGTGHFWYGTLVKIDAKGKKSVVAKDVLDDTIPYSGTKLYYSNIVKDVKDIAYTVKTGKKTAYTLTVKDNQTIDILGSNTYLTDTSSKSNIYVSRFTSGTNKKNLTKNFIKIPYSQNKKYDYSGECRKIGSNYVVGLTAIDFSDQSYGWRGRMAGIVWFVADKNGKIIGSFK